MNQTDSRYQYLDSSGVLYLVKNSVTLLTVKTYPIRNVPDALGQQYDGEQWNVIEKGTGRIIESSKTKYRILREL